jgi:hypothetical protein
MEEEAKGQAEEIVEGALLAVYISKTGRILAVEKVDDTKPCRIGQNLLNVEPRESGTGPVLHVDLSTSLRVLISEERRRKEDSGDQGDQEKAGGEADKENGCDKENRAGKEESHPATYYVLRTCYNQWGRPVTCWP